MQLHSVLTRDLPSNGMPLRFTDNHDHPRSCSLWGTDGLKLAYTIVLTSKGYPDVFGGDEVGFAPPKDIQYSQNNPVIWNYNNPIYDYFKKIIAIRNQYLKSDLKQYWIKNNSIAIYSSLSVSRTNMLIIVANCSRFKKSATLYLSNHELGIIKELTELISRAKVPYDGNGLLKITLGGYKTKILLVTDH